MTLFLAGCLSGGGGGGGNGGGGTDGGGDTSVTLRTTSVNPTSADNGDRVVVSYEIESSAGGTSLDPNQIRVMLGTAEILPASVGEGTLAFDIPGGVAGDVNLFLRAGDVESNRLLFSVTDGVSVVTADPDDLIDMGGGAKVAANLVMLFIADGLDLDATAEAAAIAENGEVVGKIDALRARQLRLPTTTFAELEAAIERLLARTGIEDVMMDTYFDHDAVSVDWSGDPDISGQRQSNRVEEGVDVYVSNVHPTRSGAVVPFFRSMGVFEAGVQFSRPDYQGYASSGSSRSGGVSLYAPDRGTSTSTASRHGTNVVGLIAAELGDAGSAGLLRAIGEANASGGFNVRVGNSAITSAHAFMSEVVLALQSGAKVFNMSAGVHKCQRYSGASCAETALQSNGSLVTSNLYPAFAFDGVRAGFDRIIALMERDYPEAIMVVSAGNGNTDAGDQNWRLFGAHPSNQVLTVGAHSNSSMPTRESYSNYGERVDIAAAGTVRSAWNDSATSGTSYAAPLVAATIVAMRSIEPNLTPTQVRNALRQTALPIDNNEVSLRDTSGNEIGTTVFTRPISASEAADDASRQGKGARLNVEGAILRALELRDGRTRPIGTPVTVDITGSTSVTQRISVTVPGEGSVFDRVDIMFLVDVSGSYGGSIAQFKSQAEDLVRAFEASGSDVHTGIASFSDTPISPWGISSDYAYRLDQALTGDGALTIEAINSLLLQNGADTPESQLEALFQLATGSGRTVPGQAQANIAPSVTGWRDGSLRIIFFATDANFHTPANEDYGVYSPGYPGPTWASTVAALNARGIRVYGLERGSAVRDVRSMVDQTGGEVFQLDSSSSDIVRNVEAALENAAESLDLRLVPNGDFARMVRNITPDLIEDVSRGETVSFDVTLNRGDAGPGEQRFVFRLDVVGAGTAVIEEIPLIINLD
ncbi:MAG: S8 family serine peptidase [Pseudomonas sp.]